ncbi:nitroreductase/quinone reductase family protein [Actinotalea sp. AC32]|nr:nitroreductase/quinone reductase family protein [Actinotalea sp. AC32]
MAKHVRTAVVVAALVAGVAALRRARGSAGARRGGSPRSVEAQHPPRALVRAVNPFVRWLLSSPGRGGRAQDELMLLHVTGRRTGRTYDIPVGFHPGEDGRLVVVTDAPWRLNLRDLPDVEVTLRGVRRPAHAELVETPGAAADDYLGRIDPSHPQASARKAGLRLAEDRVPTRDQLVDLARREHLCAIHVDVAGERAAA